MSNLFKSGFSGIQTISDEPFVLDANSRVIEIPKERIIRPVSEREEENEFSEGLSQEAEVVRTPENQELLDDAVDKASSVLEDSRELARKIVEDAKAEAESIYDAAREDGHRQGYEEGSMEAARHADEQIEQMNCQQEEKIAALKKEMEADIENAEKKIVDIACGLIEKLTGMLVSDYKPVMIHMINNVLNEDDASRKFIIRVAEEQYPYIFDNRDRLVGAANPGISIEIFGDAKLTAGQCQIESDTGIVDLSMDVQVRNLITAIKLLSE